MTKRGENERVEFKAIIKNPEQYVESVVAFANTALTEVIDSGGDLVEDGNVDAAVKAVEGLILDERRWSEAFARSHDALALLADEALAETPST